MLLARGPGRGDEKGCANEVGLVLVFREVGACGWLAISVVDAEGGGVFLLEYKGYAGAPDSTRVAGVCERRLGREIIIRQVKTWGKIMLP